MKLILFIAVLGIFAWLALVPPDGFSKYPNVHVEMNSAQTGPLKATLSTSEKGADLVINR